MLGCHRIVLLAMITSSRIISPSNKLFILTGAFNEYKDKFEQMDVIQIVLYEARKLSRQYQLPEVERTVAGIETDRRSYEAKALEFYKKVLSFFFFAFFLRINTPSGLSLWNCCQDVTTPIAIIPTPSPPSLGLPLIAEGFLHLHLQVMLSLVCSVETSPEN